MLLFDMTASFAIFFSFFFALLENPVVLTQGLEGGIEMRSFCVA